MRSSSIAILVLLVATLTAILWPSRAAFSGKTTVNFTVWGMPFEDRLFRDVYAREWERLNPGLSINYQRYNDALLMKYNAWHVRGRGSEVMRLRVTDYHGMVERGMLEPLDGYNDPGGVDLASRARGYPLWVNGHVYAVPEDNAQFGMFINLDIVEEYNRAHPDEKVIIPSQRPGREPIDATWSNGPSWNEWTWEHLRRAARVLTERDSSGRVTRAGLDFTVWSWPFMSFFAQAGGHLWWDGLTCTIDSEAGVEALEFMRALQREDRSFVPNLSGFLSGTGPDVLFAAGKTAILLDGSWRVPTMERVAPDLNFCVVPVPRGKRRAVVSGCVCWGISSKAVHKDEGARMIGYLTDTPQALAYWDMLRVAPPASSQAMLAPEFRSTRGVRDADGTVVVPAMTPELYEKRAAWLLYGVEGQEGKEPPPSFIPTGPYQTELEEEIQRMLNRYLNPDNQETAREVLSEVVRNVHAVIDRDRVARGLPPVQRPQSPGR